MTEEQKTIPYNPYKSGQWEKIKSSWELYKEVGLEGDIHLKLKKKGKSETEIQKVIERHRIEIAEDIKVWRSLR